MTAALSVPPVGPDETANQYEQRVFGLVRDENNNGDDPYDLRAHVTFRDGRTYTGHPGGTADLVYAVEAGSDAEFTAFCTDRPWFQFRAGEVADVEAVQ